MAIFASTTSTGYSDPIKALSIKALEQRLKDQQAQSAAEKPDAAMMATIPGGIGHVLGVVGDQMKEARSQQALAANRDTLAKAMTGLDMDNPDPAKMATIASLAPDIHTHLLQTWAENRRADRNNAVATRGQDVTAGTTTRGQDVTARGQDVTAATTARGQDITARGQDVVSADTQRGQDVTARGQDVTAATTTRGQDMTSADTQRGQDVTARGQDAVAATTTRGQDMTQDTAVRGQDTTAATTTRGQDVTARGQDMTQDTAARGQDITARGQDMANRVKMDDLTKGTGIQSDYARHAQALDNLSEARDLLKQGINHGFWGSAQTKAAQIAEGRWGTDADAAARTTRFNQLMDEQAITKMAAQLKGQTTNFEMGEFQKIVNNPNVRQEDRIAALDRLIAQASVDKDVHGSAARVAQKQIGGPTVEDIDATIAKTRGGGDAAAAPVTAVASEADALALQPGTRFKLPDGRTGTAR